MYQDLGSNPYLPKGAGQGSVKGLFDQMLKQAAQILQREGSNGDTILAHINRQEAALLKSRGGAGTVNPRTGLLQFDSDSSDSGGEGPGGEGPSGASGPGTGANGTGNGTGGVGGDGTDTSDGPTGNGVKSSTAAEEQSAVSNTASQTGLSGLANDISVGAQHAATSIANTMGISSATVGNIGKAAVAAAFGGLPGAAMSLAGNYAGVPGIGDVGKSMVDHGVDKGNNPGGTGDPGQSGIGGGENGDGPQAPGLLAAMALNGGGPAAPAAMAAQAVAPPFVDPWQGYAPYNPMNSQMAWQQRQQRRGLFG